MRTVAEAAQWLRHHDDYLILTHRRPDGDAVGSAIALCLGLRALGKQAFIWENPQFTPRYAKRLEGLTTKNTDAATVIAVDLASQTIFPMGGQEFLDKVQFCIDHHGSNTGYAAQSLVLPEYAACGEVIWEVLESWGVEISREMAEAVYIAVSTDTGCFRFANTTANTFRVASGVVAHGAQIAPINRELFEVKSKSRLQLEARLMSHMEFYQNGTVALCCLPQSWVEELAISEDDLDSISAFPRTVDGVNVGVMIRNSEPGVAKMSVRSAPGFDASAYCGQLGGGGHVAAAGAAIPGTLEDGKNAILAVLRQFEVIS